MADITAHSLFSKIKSFKNKVKTNDFALFYNCPRAQNVLKI